MNSGDAWRYVKHSVRQYGSDNCAQLAAAISYYVLFSIVPLTFVLVSVFGLVIRSERVRSEVVERVVDFIGLEKGDAVLRPETSKLALRFSPAEIEQFQAAVARLQDSDREEIAARLLKDGTAQVNGRIVTKDEVFVRYQNTVSDTLNDVAGASPPFTAFSLMFSVWSGSAMFGAVRKALNIVWRVAVQRAYLQQKLLDVVMVVALGVMMLLSVAGTAGLRAVRELSGDALGPFSSGTGPFWGAVPYVLPGILSFAVFGLLYRFVPAVRVRFRDVWFGALVAALLFEVLKNAFAFYVANFEAYDLLYGSLGGILLFLTAVYLASSVLLFGGELAAAMPGLGAGAFASVRDPTKPRLSLVQEARTELVKSFRSLVWARGKRESESEDAGSDREAGQHLS